MSSLSGVFKGLPALGKKPGFWFIFAILIILTLFHYEDTLGLPVWLSDLISGIGLNRHAFERILYLAPIIWAGFLFGWKGFSITSVIALACMLPRVIFISATPMDALFETASVFIIGNVLAISFQVLRKEREYRTRLEIAHKDLEVSEQRYRQLFENAHDAIWVQDMEGNIVTVNRATNGLTGYDTEQLIGMNVSEFLPEEGLTLAREVRRKLLKGELVDSPYEQSIIRKDGRHIVLQISSSLIRGDEEANTIQHIARDVTEQKRMQDNLHFYLEQATRAQEEERKRISRELHDDTIQALVVLSRRLDTLVSTGQGISEETRLRLEELIKEVNDIMRGVRRLSQDLRPAALDRLGLLSALEWLASDISEYSGMNIKVKVIGDELQLSEEVGLVLFRITQEALRNVWRHAQATNAEITVEFIPGKLRIIITDNGKGFDPPQRIGDLAKDGKLGLTGMQERARLIGATMYVQSEQGQGSRVTVELPL